MSRFLVSHGAPLTGPPDLSPEAGWQRFTAGQTHYAWQPGDDMAENGGFFASPDGECSGLLAGTVFNLGEWLAPYPASRPAFVRLGLCFHDLYRRHGCDFPTRLDGAFALVMALDDQLLVVRDAIGERPLYLSARPQGAVVADRMALLTAHPLCQRRLHPGAAMDFLSTGFCPFERTPVRGIHKIPPGSLWIVRGETIRRHGYHRLTEIIESPEKEADYVHRLRDLLNRAVAKRGLPGVKTGLLLSGGLDSSLVGALVGGERLQAAYSLSFGPRYRNELEFSSLMARQLGIPHRVIGVSPQAVRDHFLATMAILDEPIGDPLTVPNVLVARAAAREVQVIFNGEGGDPLFGGPKNLPMLAAEAFGPVTGDRSLEDLYLMSYNKGSQYLDQLLHPDFRRQADGFATPARLLSPYLNDTGMTSLLNRLMQINLRLKGAAQILPKVFKIASAAGLAVRSPLFDRHLAEASFQIPPGLKLKGSIEKYILKEAARGRVPEAIIQRPKSGMLVPVQYWFREELRRFAREMLLSPESRSRSLYDRDALQQLLAFQGGGIRGYHGDRIWLLLSLEFWMRAHGITL